MTSTRHGVTLTDDYAWLRADNWREVMRDPSRARSEDPRLSRGRERLRQGRARAHRAAAGDAVRRDEGAHQGGRLHGAEPGRPVRLFHALSRGRPASDRSAASRATAAPSRCCSTATRSRPARPIFQLGGMRAFARPSRCSPGRPTTRARNTTRCACAISRPAAILPDVIPDVAGSPVWTADSSAFYYVRLDANHRPSRVYRHRLGTPAADDALVYEEPDSRFFVSLGRTQSGRFAEISVHDHETSEMLADRSGGRRTRSRGWSRRARPRCSTTSSITRTGPARECWSSAPMRTARRTSRSCVTPLAEPARENWRDLVPHRRGIYRARHHACCRTG